MVRTLLLKNKKCQLNCYKKSNIHTGFNRFQILPKYSNILGCRLYGTIILKQLQLEFPPFPPLFAFKHLTNGHFNKIYERVCEIPLQQLDRLF